jgi:hypothetical protein
MSLHVNPADQLTRFGFYSLRHAVTIDSIFRLLLESFQVLAYFIINIFIMGLCFLHTS